MTRPEEKRRHARLPKNYRVELCEFIFPITRQPRIEVSCVDIGVGGLAVECPRRFELKSKLQVKVFIPRLNKYHPGFFKVFESDVRQHLQAVAQVAWVVEKTAFSRYAMGLEFLDVYEDDWQALRTMIRSMAR